MKRRLPAFAALLAAATILGCSSEKHGTAEEAGQPCASADECFRNVTEPLQGGEAVCLDRVPGGYCTHYCVDDSDCCAVPNECRTPLPQLCAPYESTGQKHCFLSCEPADVSAAGFGDANEYCRRYAHSSFNCRSTGGGSENRKVCTL